MDPETALTTPDMASQSLSAGMSDKDVAPPKEEDGSESASKADSAGAMDAMMGGGGKGGKGGFGSDETMQKVMAPPVTIDSAQPSRIIVFNIADTDMNGTLSMEEFFTFLRVNVIFSVLANQEELPEQYSITKQLFDKNEGRITEYINTFPQGTEESSMKTLSM